MAAWSIVRISVENNVFKYFFVLFLPFLLLSRSNYNDYLESLQYCLPYSTGWHL